MDTLSVIALIVVALVIVAVIIAFRHKLAVALEFLGLKLNVQAENEATPTESPPASAQAPAGVRARNLKSKRGISIEEGRAADPSGVGIEAEGLEAGGDIIIGKGESGDPKAQPPA